VALSYFPTYGVPVCVTRSSNNYGPHQHPEKIIPRFATSLLKGLPVRVHGRGAHLRNWLHVEDHCQGIDLVLRGGRPGEVCNIGGGTDLTTNELTALILNEFGAGWDAVEYVVDRQANGIRYSMDWTKIAEQLGFQPRRNLEQGLAETVQWYRDNPDRWAPLLRGPDAARSATVLAAQWEF
jgi:dTDP-glucose 4,6-dehydratase